METKALWQSKTFWGALVAILASLAGFAGFAVDAGDQAVIVETATTIAGALGGLFAIYGRIKASKPVK